MTQLVLSYYESSNGKVALEDCVAHAGKQMNKVCGRRMFSYGTQNCKFYSYRA